MNTTLFLVSDNGLTLDRVHDALEIKWPDADIHGGSWVQAIRTLGDLPKVEFIIIDEAQKSIAADRFIDLFKTGTQTIASKENFIGHLIFPFDRILADPVKSLCELSHRMKLMKAEGPEATRPATTPGEAPPVPSELKA